MAPFSKEKIPISADSLKSDNLYPDLNDEKYDKNAYYGKDMWFIISIVNYFSYLLIDKT